jgi:two-component system OmpR family sensor kinase
MTLLPGEETIPFHIGWVGLCVSYGFALWPARLTIASILGYACASGVVLAVRADSGVLGWGETAEIPLMSVVALVMAWHVARRVEAIKVVTAVAEEDRRRLEERERLSRMYSHEMRTPLTIARGYLSLLQAEELTAEQHDDLLVVDDELSTLERVGDRLIRMLAVTDQQTRTLNDIGTLVDEVARRWGTVAERRWVVDVRVSTLHCSRARLRMCLDTLIENALRYTDPSDVIRIFAFATGGDVVIGVADSGPGLSDELVLDINSGGTGHIGDDGGRDARRQTGLGLALVHEVSESLGGCLRADRSDEGGAMISMVVPRRSPAGGQAGAVPRGLAVEGA